MNEEFLSTINHDLSFRPGIIKEALAKGVKFGTKEFFVYSQLRWYETDGKFGFCVAGNERLGEDVGMGVKEVENALNRLRDCGLVEHIWCDKKEYRHKTKIWMSTVRLANVCTNVDAIKVLKKGGKNVAVLGKTTSPQVETTSPQVVAPPVTTGVGNTNRNTNRNIVKSLVPNGTTDFPKSSPDGSDDTKAEGLDHSSPFDEEVVEVVRLHDEAKDKQNKVAGALVTELCKIVGADSRGQNTAVANTKKLMNKGFTVDEIRQMVEWTTKDEFYKDKPLHTRLGNDPMQQFLLAKNKNQSSNGKINYNPEGDIIW